jgi:hypothetical protein
LAGVLAAVLQQVLLLGLALAFASELKMAALKISSKCPVTKIDER